MLPVTVVIITKNEAKNIVACIRSAKAISNDIVVVDAESEDETASLTMQENCKVINLKWIGYGYARNIGAAAAKYNWILSLDADERIPQTLVDQLHRDFIDDKRIIYGFGRRNFFAGKEIKYGCLGFDKTWRLYNRNIAKWDTSPVHEKLTGCFSRRKYVGRSIDHYTIQDEFHYKNKSTKYAYLCAVKYFQEGKTSTSIKRVMAAPFNFLKSYFFLLGFLDGKKGLSVSKVNAYYTWLKYQHLHELTSERQRVTSTNPLSSFKVDVQSLVK